MEFILLIKGSRIGYSDSYDRIYNLLQMSSSDGSKGICKGNNCAVLGKFNACIISNRRQGQNGIIGSSASPANRTSASMENTHINIIIPANLTRILLPLFQCPVGHPITS